MRKLQNVDARKVVACDIDGTLTDFEGFLKIYAQKYMKKYGDYIIKNVNGYDIDGLYDLEGDEAKDIHKKFWNRYYFTYTMIYPMRTGASELLNELKRRYIVILFSSREQTCYPGIRGKIVRKMTKMQLFKNGIKPDKLLFFENDRSKIDAINSYRPVIVIDDKVEVLKETRAGKKFCVASNYNKNNHDGVRISTLAEIYKFI